MIRFNIIGRGFIETEVKSVSFRRSNPWFRFAEVEIGRSVEFDVPATDHNRELLDFGEDPLEYGSMLRIKHDCQMVYDGGAKRGTLSVMAYEGGAFRCVFYIGDSSALDVLRDKPLTECAVPRVKGIAWRRENQVAAAQAVPASVVELVAYRGNGFYASDWACLPSVCIRTFLENVFDTLGVPYVMDDLSYSYWMVACSLNSNDNAPVRFIQSSDSSVSVQSADFDVLPIEIEWATDEFLGALIGGGSVSSFAFVPSRSMKVVFGNDVPDNTFLIKWNDRLKRCETIAGNGTQGATLPNIPTLKNGTVQMGAGGKYFFAAHPGPNCVQYEQYVQGYLPSYGWYGNKHPLDITAVAYLDQELLYGFDWQLQANMPQMTVFEFVKSVCLATGLEFDFGEDGEILITRGSYGSSDDFKALHDVVSVESVRRNVEAWGGGVSSAQVEFDSEDYVTDKLVSVFDIDNENLGDVAKFVSKFNEGATMSDNDIVIDDCDNTGDAPKLSSKRWTITLTEAPNRWPKRVPLPQPFGYDDIAANSTAVVVTALMSLDEYFSLRKSDTLLWRGIAFLWTQAEWSGGMVRLTLQKVSSYSPQGGS